MLPVVRTLQTVLPASSITWIIGKTEYQLVKGIQGIEFIIFDKSRGFNAYLDLYKNIRGRRFDVLLHMQAALRASIASLLIKAPIKIGFDKSRAADFQHYFCNKQIPTPPRSHVLDGFFGFLQAMGINERVMSWEPHIPESDMQFARRFIKPQHTTLVINPCTSVRRNNYRNWKAEYYAAVADHAMQTLGLNVVLTGGPDTNEVEMAEQISKLCKTSPINLVGKTSIKQILAVIKSAGAILAPDTGPAHMGTAVGTAVIGLYVTSNPNRSGPYNDLESVVNAYPQAVKKEYGQTEADISWGKRVRNPDAVDLITVDSVIKQLDKTIKQL